MDIIGYTCTRNLINKLLLKKCMTERLKKIEEDNFKKEGERILVSKTWEGNICYGKIIKHRQS